MDSVEDSQETSLNATIPLTAAKKHEIDAKLAKMFFRTGISFRILDSDAFRELVAALNPEYAEQMPKSRTLSGILLNNQYDEARQKMNKIVQESDELSLVTDGWTNVRGDHIVNFLIKAPSNPSMFYKSINTSGTVQDADNVSAAIIEVMEEIGPEKFNSVVSDNAPVLRAAWKKIGEKYPKISAFGCAAHALNLLVKDLLDPYDNVLSEASKIIKFFNNHHRARSLFDEACKTDDTARKLLVAVPTRWSTQYDSLKSVLESKYVLNKLCDHSNEELKNIATTASVVIKIIKTATFWTDLNNAVKIIEFPVNIIGKVEADEAELSLVYHYFERMFEHFKNDRIAHAKIKKRWDFIKKDVHSLSYILTPKYVLSGNFIEDKLEEISKMTDFAAKRDSSTAQATSLELLRYLNDLQRLPEQHKDFCAAMKASEYWNVIGKEKYPLVYACAKSINEMTCSSASSGRVWSIFGFVQKALRNRVANEKVEKLVFLYVNSGLLDEKDKSDYIFEDILTLDGEDFVE